MKIQAPISSMEKMYAWNRENLGERFETAEMRKPLIRADFHHQAKEDGVIVLEIGEDVWGLSEYFHNNIEELRLQIEMNWRSRSKTSNPFIGRQRRRGCV